MLESGIDSRAFYQYYVAYESKAKEAAVAHAARARNIRLG
jgi:hypothetical protein